MIEWPFCPVHNEPMQLTCVGGNWLYVCPACKKAPLTYYYSTTTDSNMGDKDND